MAPFDRYLDAISKKISIRDEDREPYIKDFEAIRNHVLDMMKSYDSDFKRICKGPSLFGSMAYKGRLFKPTEFDVLIQLSFPFSKDIDIEIDEDRPGFINLDFTYVKDYLEEQNDDLCEILDYLMDYENGYLKRSKLKHWISDIISGALDLNGSRMTGAWGTVFDLEYSPRGLAHTIYAHGSRYNISIDFVPAIMLGQADWMDIRDDHPFAYKCERWYAVPKPALGPKRSRRYSFLICNPKVEHYLLLGKQNLKVVFRLLKSIIKNYQLRRFKSYFIATAFLWEVERQEDDFWSEPVSEILTHMLGVLSEYLADGDLPFFWDRDKNLLDVLSNEELESYSETVTKIYLTLRSYHHQPNLSWERCLCHFKMRND